MDQSYGTEEQLISAVQEINAHATKEEYRYKHFYSPGDIFCWDNYQTLHRGPVWPVRHLIVNAPSLEFWSPRHSSGRGQLKTPTA